MQKILLLTALALLIGCKEENKPATTQKQAEEAAAAAAEAKEALAIAEAEAAKIAESEPEQKNELGSMTDTRDGKTYKTTKIGEQVWMAENLNFEAEGSKCNKNNKANCEKYGRLYDWKTAMKVCPNGWHLPSEDEWNVLIDFAGGKKIAGKKLKVVSGWYDDNGKPCKGTDDYGFAALPGGSGDTIDDDFNDVGKVGFWWSSSGNDSYAQNVYMYGVTELASWFEYETFYMFSVRCVRD